MLYASPKKFHFFMLSHDELSINELEISQLINNNEKRKKCFNAISTRMLIRSQMEAERETNIHRIMSTDL